MTREYLKKATLTSASGASDVHDTVVGILNDIEAGGDAKALEYAAKFDQYDGNVLRRQKRSKLQRPWCQRSSKPTFGLPMTMSGALPRFRNPQWPMCPTTSFQARHAAPNGLPRERIKIKFEEFE